MSRTVAKIGGGTCPVQQVLDRGGVPVVNCDVNNRENGQGKGCQYKNKIKQKVKSNIGNSTKYKRCTTTIKRERSKNIL